MVNTLVNVYKCCTGWSACTLTQEVLHEGRRLRPWRGAARATFIAAVHHPAVSHLGRRSQRHVSHAHHGPLADVACGILIDQNELLHAGVACQPSAHQIEGEGECCISLLEGMVDIPKIKGGPVS